LQVDYLCFFILTCNSSDYRDGLATVPYPSYPRRAVLSSQTININRLKGRLSATCPYRFPSKRTWTWESLAVKSIAGVYLAPLTPRRDIHTHTDFTLDESDGECRVGTVPRRRCNQCSVYTVERGFRRRICGKRRCIMDI
jgi:hypothetical protein